MENERSPSLERFFPGWLAEWRIRVISFEHKLLKERGRGRGERDRQRHKIFIRYSGKVQ